MDAKTLRLFLLILFVGIIFRFFQLTKVPPSLNWDEVAIGWNAHSIWEVHIDEYGKRFPLSFQSYGDFKAPLYIYGTAPFVGILGLNTWAVRLPSAIAGILTVAVVFFLAQEIGKQLGIKSKQRNIFALLSMTVMAVSPWHLMFSRGAYEANVALFFVTTGIWLFFVSLNKPKLYFFSGLSLILSLYTYHSPKIFLILFLPVLVVLFHKKVFTGLWKNKLISIIAIMLLMLASSPIVYDNLKGHGAERIGTSIFFQDGELRPFDTKLATDIIHNFRAHLTTQFYTNGDTRNPRNTLQNYGLMPSIQLVFFLISILYLFRLPKEKSKFGLILIMWFILALVPGALSRGLEVPHNLRTLNALPAITIMSVFGFLASAQEVSITIQKHKKSTIWLKVFYIFVAVSFISSLGFYFYEYYVEYPVYAAKDWQYGYKEAVTTAREYEDQVEQIKITTAYGQPHIFTYFYQNRGAMEPLWGGLVKYHYNTVNWEGDQFLKNRLFIGTPEELPKDIPEDQGEFIKDILFPDGTVAFRIVRTY